MKKFFKFNFLKEQSKLPRNHKFLCRENGFEKSIILYMSIPIHGVHVQNPVVVEEKRDLEIV